MPVSTDSSCTFTSAFPLGSMVPSKVANLLVSTIVPFFTDWKDSVLDVGSSRQD